MKLARIVFSEQDRNQEQASSPMPPWRAAALVAGIVFTAALFGHLTRPLGFLSTFWPANALLMGVMVRNPGWAGPLGWIGATVGYLAADFAMGGGIGVTLWLTAGNLTDAFVGYRLFQRISECDRRLEQPPSLLFLLLISFATAVVAACVSCGSLVLYFGYAPLQAFEFVLTSEFASNLVVLPVVLTAPPFAPIAKRLAASPVLRSGWSRRLQPVAALLASILAGTMIGGSAAIAIPVPAILWCALSYGVFPTALLTFGLGLWQCTVLLAQLTPGTADYAAALTSHRFGVALFSLGPIMVAVINAARAGLLAELDQAANQDSLTKALSRRAFLARSEAALGQNLTARRPIALLMLDVDRFKLINDEYGHAVGDEVLVSLAEHISARLRPDDLFGRIGGEEFAIMAPGLTQAAGLALAERLRDGCARLRVPVKGREPLRTTVSIGLVWGSAGPDCSLRHLLKRADDALYRAKRAGRDRVVDDTLQAA
ncbi:diguanylate cyclase (GGDEF) domain-containing protein [Bosea sp. CRIB-10]|uniref:sensor domain-containing diguanylate cyclase n=1 Tax=Bosea sp. CRIB-10 TaxID=378404 RepID=UPI0008EBA80B|nr:GGDEF domain-containing protein [Bosea sp. CRIB-10]SFC00693.1 diguanylate cyclase (GGDEF) domain-containing protein [Bosea sp. CRIB-10]